MLMEADLPDDVDALRLLILDQARELEALKLFKAEVERLRAIIDALQSHRFGRRSEQLDPDQLQLGLVTVLCRSPISLGHLGLECEGADATQK